jgi:hypothetical protein
MQKGKNMKLKTLSVFACILILAALLLLLPGTSGAAALKPASAGGTVSYSGNLSNDAGQPVSDGAYAFSFALYDATTGGKLLWSETQPGVALKGGAFNVQLGSATPLPTQARISQGWLAVGVRGPGETVFTELSPRQPLNTVVSAPASSAVAGGTCAHDHFGASWTGSASNGLYIQNTNSGGFGIKGEVNNSWSAVYGQNTGNGTGVYGEDNSGTGVSGYSANGIGVQGYTSSGWALAALGNTYQSMNSGGWIKAMALVSGTSITRCYNSQLSSDSVSTPPCGISSSGSGGTYTVTFGFQVSDRFITVTPYWGGSGTPSAIVDSFPTSNQVKVRLSADSAFFIIIY